MAASLGCGWVGGAQEAPKKARTVRLPTAAVKPAFGVHRRALLARHRLARCATMPAVNTPAPELLHVDESLIVAVKPAGLLAVPGRTEPDCLAARVQALYADARVVHRLDQATSGLMLMARGAAMQRSLSRAFETRQVHKRYVAIVEGVLAADQGDITAPLTADWPQRPRQQVQADGKPALTRWRVLARHADHTRLALEPVTGRTHQLRVHLAHIGHPVRGDRLYAPAPWCAERLLLHAGELAFVHPLQGVAMRFSSPADFG